MNKEHETEEFLPSSKKRCMNLHEHDSVQDSPTKRKTTDVSHAKGGGESRSKSKSSSEDDSSRATGGDSISQYPHTLENDSPCANGGDSCSQSPLSFLNFLNGLVQKNNDEPRSQSRSFKRKYSSYASVNEPRIQSGSCKRKYSPYVSVNESRSQSRSSSVQALSYGPLIAVQLADDDYPHPEWPAAPPPPDLLDYALKSLFK